MSLKRVIFLNILFFSLLSYFTYHTFFGKRGVIAKNQMQQKIISLSYDLQSLRDKRVEIEHNVSLLRSNSLDSDALEELAKKMLGYAKKREKIIIIK